MTLDLLPTRASIACMIFTACLISYMLKVNMSINLIAMVEPARSGASNEQIMSHLSECVVQRANASEMHDSLTSPPDYGERYAWNSQTQGLILGSYFWGYMVSSMPGGYIAERFGPRNTIGVTTLASGALTILTPLAAQWHYGFVIAIRIMLGLLGGVVYPGLHCLISKWAPPVEKGKFVGALMGGTLGTVITWPMLGFTLEHWGWNWAFFIPGGISVLWCLVWYYVVSDTPDEHPRIKDEERFYIAKSHGGAVTQYKSIPPYKAMFLSVPFWALVILHFGSLWGLYLLLTAGPKFMSEVLGFNLGHSGILASLPYLARMVFGFTFGIIGDYIRKAQKISVTCMRKSFIFFSHVVPGLFLFGQTMIGCDATLGVAFLTLALGINGASTLTNLANSQDLAPNFAGTIYGIINCIAGISGFITPMITGYITAEKNGLHEWHIIFSIGASVYIGCGLIYCLIGSGEHQPWNNIKNDADGEKATNGGIDNIGFDFQSDVRCSKENQHTRV